MCVAVAYMIAMSMFGQQTVSTTASVIPSSFSLNYLSHLDAAAAAADAAVVGCTTSTVTMRQCTTAADTREFTVSSGEFRSVRQHSVDSSLSTGVISDSQRTQPSQESCSGSSRLSMDSMVSVRPQHSVGSEVSVTSQRSVDSMLSSGVMVPRCHTSQFDDSDHDVFSESMLSRFSQTTNVEQPPPLPPKTSVVS